MGTTETFPISGHSVKFTFETKVAGLTAKACASGTVDIEMMVKSVKLDEFIFGYK